MAFKPTLKQLALNQLLASDATHCMAYGGSRSGKTLWFVYCVLQRALAYPSRHAILRFRFNHVKASIVYDTLPKVMDLCFPGEADHCKLDKTDWFYRMRNGSEIWFGGLDDKERVEKILGNEYASMFLNECSQIPWASRNMALTRLAQKTPLRLKMYYDCNPPSTGHWTHKIFQQHVDPDTRLPLRNPENYGYIQINPEDNAENIADGYLEELRGMSERMKKRFLYGQFSDAQESAIWSMELLDQQRKRRPELIRIVVAVDPSGCDGPEDTRSDQIGIVVVGLGEDGCGYILEDVTGHYSPRGWAKAVLSCVERWGADCIVAESNYGGAMVKAVIQAENPRARFKDVVSSRGKHIRAEPVAQLFESQKVWLDGAFPELEDEMCAMTPSGYTGNKSPNRLDAMVFGITELFPAIANKQAANQREFRVVTSQSATQFRRR